MAVQDVLGFDERILFVLQSIVCPLVHYSNPRIESIVF